MPSFLHLCLFSLSVYLKKKVKTKYGHKKVAVALIPHFRLSSEEKKIIDIIKMHIEKKREISKKIHVSTIYQKSE